MTDVETLLQSLQRQAKESFIETGRFDVKFSISRQQTLQLLEDLRAARIFYNLDQVAVEKHQRPYVRVRFEGLTITSDGRG